MDQSLTMEYKRLGNTGLKVSRFCLGMMSYGSSKWAEWVLNEKQALPLIKKAWEIGINFFDTADVYSNGESERILGRAIKSLEIPRDQIVIATKLNFQVADNLSTNTLRKPGKPSPSTVNSKGLSRKHIFEACDASLQRLQTDYIDLYQIHRWDNDTPIEETMEALNDLVRSGKVRYIGASSMHAWQFAKAQHVAEKNGWAKFSSMQNLYNLIYREEEREMIPLCKDQGVGIIPWSPLARGLLSGKQDASVRTRSDPNIKMWFGKTKDVDDVIIDVLRDIAEKRNASCAVVALSWLLSKEAVTSPIVGVNKEQYFDDMLSAISIKLTEDEVKRLEENYVPKRVVGHQ
ncbi:versiconal hemiacetal acetate reductase [Acrasis kona]|uniref:Versiconal hemiacetal acetate reductase n=1 Tax=Acrasis kona TaxID=1008807 RepID=A0AAW2YQG9_9EUKA